MQVNAIEMILAIGEVITLGLYVLAHTASQVFSFLGEIARLVKELRHQVRGGDDESGRQSNGS